MVPSSGFYVRGINKSELKTQELVVGAPRFELGTSCAQARRVMFWKSFLCNVIFENKRLGETFGCGKKYEIVAPHVQSPPNFPHSERKRPALGARHSIPTAPFPIANC